jgi:hypothetical protein
VSSLETVDSAPAAHYTAALFAPIAEELVEQLTLFNQKGAGYARAYLQYLRAGGQGYGPRAPLGMNAHVARAIREVVMDHAQHARFTAGRRMS